MRQAHHPVRRTTFTPSINPILMESSTYFLGSYDTVQEAELILQKANEMLSEGKFEEGYKDYKITLRKRHDLYLIEAKKSKQRIML